MTFVATNPKTASGDSDRIVVLDRAKLDGAVFDLDGVITTTARLHEGAWAEAFDAYFVDQLDQKPFSHADYRRYVDGRARRDGIRRFLASRGFAFEETTVDALATEKNAIYLKSLERDGADLLPGARSLLDEMRRAGLRIGLFTASRNATRVLETVGLSDAFDAQVDGNVAADERLAGKPAPDLPLACAARLGVVPSRCALFEDAEAGIRAGLAGGFARVIGVASGADAEGLLAIGAQDVVGSLADVRVQYAEGAAS